MRVVHVIPGLARHGAETVMYRLITSLDNVEHEVVCFAGRDWYSSLLEARGVRVHHLNRSSASRTMDVVRLSRLIRKSGADVVQCWMYRANLFGGLAGALARVPVVWNVRCSDLEPLPFSTRLLVYAGGLLARFIPRVVINCSAQSGELHARLGYSSAPLWVIPNGYEIPDFPKKSDCLGFRRSLSIEPGTFLIGSIGRWHPMKGYPVLLRALRLLTDRGVKASLVLVGSGLDEKNGDLAQLIRDNGCAQLVHLLGERSDVPLIAAALDLHVLASIGSEGFPNVVAETMLSGTPNVATDIGDSALIVGETGWVVTPGDAAALADAIEQACKEHASAPEEWARRRNSARNRIVENFSLERMIRAYEEVWHKCVGKQPLNS